MDLVRPLCAIAWELRAAWATGRRVALSLSERCEPPRIEGHVQCVAAMSVFVRVNGLVVPLDEVLAVHLPSRLGDSTARDAEFHGPALREQQIPGQLDLGLS